jgi:DNA-directed RNA polymerase specialized sigma24 family protein
LHTDTLVALAALSSLQREAVWDMDVLERSSEEIAADLGCSPQNVRMAAARGRKHLQLTLRRDDHEDCF